MMTDADESPADEDLVSAALTGDAEAMEHLVARHQDWIFNLALRMVWRRTVAEDATQEILLKIVTRLDSFGRKARFRTWAWRIAVNHLLNVQASPMERQGVTFTDMAAEMEATPDAELPDLRATTVDQGLLVEEAKTGCVTAMLMCLDRRQRLAFILGAILAVPGETAAEVMDISHDLYRQVLSRARRDLASFMHGTCGLVNPDNPCRCAKKTAAFIEKGYLDPQRMQFHQRSWRRVADVVEAVGMPADAAERAAVSVHRNQPYAEGPPCAGRIRAMIGQRGLSAWVDGELPPA